MEQGGGGGEAKGQRGHSVSTAWTQCDSVGRVWTQRQRGHSIGHSVESLSTPF
jgi:hypothetical protein